MTKSENWNKFIVSFVNKLERFKYFVAVFWFVVFVVSAVLGPRLLSSTSTQYDPPPHTLASEANTLLAQEFPSVGKTSSLGVLVRVLNASQVSAICRHTHCGDCATRVPVPLCVGHSLLAYISYYMRIC